MGGQKIKAPKDAAAAMANKPEVVNSSTEMVAPQAKTPKKQPDSASKKNAHAIIRRSVRLRGLPQPAQNQERESEVQEINLCESEKEDEPHVEEDPPESMSEERNDCLVQPVEGPKKSKAAKRHFQSDSPSADLQYKRLYFDAQKKVEALTNEKYELSKKLEVAEGKLEAYGDSSHLWLDVLEKFKDCVMMPLLGKATDATMNLSHQAILGRFSPPDDNISDPKATALPQTSAKKKKRAKGSRKN